jgi:hypothetical protein
MLRLLQLLHVWGVGIVLSAGGQSAAGQNGCGGRDHEKMFFHGCLLFGFRKYPLEVNSKRATLIQVT